ncbi:hypothetical protein GOBAR_AA06310 [Gossypium barbadense]|uniref:Uncharacterized protein n=1 Tax=Gossypium barbadense TaxID=3634 RepID=A0A2P5YF70_GOSBA|nr:hypothetical protein GOBAR_AA06310 [Gossypium barbadense]
MEHDTSKEVETKRVVVQGVVDANKLSWLEHCAIAWIEDGSSSYTLKENFYQKELMGDGKIVNCSISDGDYRNRNNLIIKESVDFEALEEVIATWNLRKQVGPVVDDEGEEGEIISHLMKIQSICDSEAIEACFDLIFGLIDFASANLFLMWVEAKEYEVVFLRLIGCFVDKWCSLLVGLTRSVGWSYNVQVAANSTPSFMHAGTGS